MRWWDYSNDFLNIQGRVSLLYSVAWGVIGVILLEKLHPLIENIIQKFSVKVNRKYSIQNIMVIVFLVLILVDTVFSTLRYLN